MGAPRKTGQTLRFYNLLEDELARHPTYSELAQVMGVSIGTLHSRLRSVRQHEHIKLVFCSLQNEPPDRNHEVSLARSSGETFQRIATFFEVTRQRAHQIARRVYLRGWRVRYFTEDGEQVS